MVTANTAKETESIRERLHGLKYGDHQKESEQVKEKINHSERKKAISLRMGEIEKEFDGFRQIPINHPEYWRIRDEFQRLTQEEREQ